VTEITAHLQFSSKRYDTFACAFPLNGNHVFATFKVRRDVLPERPIKMAVKLSREKKEQSSAVNKQG